MDIAKFFIYQGSTILDTLIKLNDLSADGLTLFVVDSDNHLLGTVTDGDIRRGLIQGVKLIDVVDVIMNKSPKYLLSTDDNVQKIKSLRAAEIEIVPIVDNHNTIVECVNLQQTRSLLPIDAVLMAGGKGERLRPLTLTTPKPLLPVGGKPIIDYNVENLIRNGVKNISVTVNYLKDQLINHYKDPIMGQQVKCIEEPAFYGTFGAVALIPEFINDSVLVMNSDLFTNIDFEEFYLHFIETNADMSVAVVPYSVSVPYGIMELEGHSIVGLQEKPVYNYYANAGIYLVKREHLSKMPQGQFFNATDMIELLISQNRSVVRFPISGYWLDIGKREEYDKACDLVRHIGE